MSARKTTIGADHEIVNHSHAAALVVAGAAPPSLPKSARAGNQRMPFGFHRDRFLQFLLHRRSQQPSGRPLVAAAADDASHQTIIRLSRMLEAANPPNIVRSRVAAPAFEVRSWRAS